MNDNLGAKGDIRPKDTTLIFFCYIASALLTMECFRLKGFDALPDMEKLLWCLALLLMLSGAYSASEQRQVSSPIMAALSGAVSAAMVCLLMSAKSGEDLYAVPILLVAIPMQFIVSVRKVRLAGWIAIAASATITFLVLFR